MTRATVLVWVSLAVGIACGNLFVPSLRAQYRTNKTTELVRTDLGAWCEGKEVTIEIIEAGPGTSGKHYHPAHSFSWIIDGSEVQTVPGRAPIAVKAGALIHEEPMQVSESENVGPVKFLQFRIIEKGKPVTTQVQ